MNSGIKIFLGILGVIALIAVLMVFWGCRPVQRVIAWTNR